jgi:hypothetical protein
MAPDDSGAIGAGFASAAPDKESQVVGHADNGTGGQDPSVKFSPRVKAAHSRLRDISVISCSCPMRSRPFRRPSASTEVFVRQTGCTASAALG